MKENTRNSKINQSEREKKLARERKREERELKRMQDAIQKKLGSSSNSNISTNLSPTPAPTALPAIPKENTASGSGGGGWTNADAGPGSSSGGWSTSAIPVAKPMIPVTVSADNNAKSTPSTTTANAPISTASTSLPKKLSFGLKKSTGFQFGLKKK